MEPEYTVIKRNFKGHRFRFYRRGDELGVACAGLSRLLGMSTAYLRTLSYRDTYIASALIVIERHNDRQGSAGVNGMRFAVRDRQLEALFSYLSIQPAPDAREWLFRTLAEIRADEPALIPAASAYRPRPSRATKSKIQPVRLVRLEAEVASPRRQVEALASQLAQCSTITAPEAPAAPKFSERWFLGAWQSSTA